MVMCSQKLKYTASTPGNGPTKFKTCYGSTVTIIVSGQTEAEMMLLTFLLVFLKLGNSFIVQFGHLACKQDLCGT